jgi:hypothetical protein
MTPPPGIHPAIRFADYLSWPYASKSRLVKILRSPAHYLADAWNPWEGSANATMGSAADCGWIDGPWALVAEYVTPPLATGKARWLNTNEGKLWSATAKAAGLTVLPHKDAGRVLGMIGALVMDPRCADILAASERQLSVVWDDPETGIRCKGRPDLWDQEARTLYDLKTTDTVQGFAFDKKAHGLGYHIQAAMYLDAMEASGHPCDEFKLITIERDPPHGIEICRFGMAEIELARAVYQGALRTLRECLLTDHWPNSSGQERTIHYPGYAFK